MTRRVLPTLSLFILLAPVATTGAQEPAGDTLFIDRVDVNVVNVEVFVTDKNGDRVVGLSRDDFEILEDGKRVDVSNFYSVNRGDRLLRDVDAPLKSPQRRRGPLPVTEPQLLPLDQQLNLLVYVDHFNLTPGNRKRVLDDLDGLLEDRIIQGDNIMLVGFDRQIQIVQNFTRDREAVRRGLRKLSKAYTYRPHQEADRRRTQELMIASFNDTNDLDSAYSHLRAHVQGVRADLRQSARALDQVVRSLAGLPGRKALLYVSDGLPQRPGEELYRQLADLGGRIAAQAAAPGSDFLDPFLVALRENEGPVFDSITRNANAHQVTFYTLDARGGSGSSSLSAASPNLAIGLAGNTQLDAMRTQNYQEPLIDMAEATGGAAILNTFNFDVALTKIANDFDAFYSLGFNTNGGGDGEYHDIEVRVKQPGMKVRHREGYVDKPLDERVADRTLSSLIFDLEKNPLGVEVDFGEPEKRSRNRYHLPILVRIPFRDITLLPNGPQEEGRLAIFLVVKDEQGGISDLHRIPYPVKVPLDQVAEVREREIGYATHLLIHRGTPKVAVGVFDEISGIESFIHKQIRVGEDKKKKGGEGGKARAKRGR